MRHAIVLLFFHLAKETAMQSYAKPKGYWARPTPKEKGDPGPEPIFLGVGMVTSHWESVEEAVAHLFLRVSGTIPGDAGSRAALRAYGAVESSYSRSKLVKSAADVYFAYNHTSQDARDCFEDLIVVQFRKASQRRNDVAHAIVQTIFKDDDDRGSFLIPPEYNTERTSLFGGESPSQIFREIYRYTSGDLTALAGKFLKLQFEIREFDNDAFGPLILR